MCNKYTIRLSSLAPDESALSRPKHEYIEFRFIIRNGREDRERERDECIAERYLLSCYSKPYKKRAKKEERIFFLLHITPHRLRSFIRKRYIFVLSLVLSLSLCTYCPFRNSLYIYSCFGLDIALSSGAKEERLTYHIYHIYQSGKRDLDWIDRKKKSFGAVWKEG